MIKKRGCINTHIARDEAGSLDEGPADVEEVPESGATQVTVGTHRETDDQSDFIPRLFMPAGNMTNN